METLEYFQKINDDKTMPKSVWLSGEDGNAMFKSGQVAAYYSGSWQVADFNKNIKDFEWMSVPLPKKEANATNLGGGFMVAFKDTGADEEAKKFIEWFYDDANYTEFAKLGGYLPVKGPEGRLPVPAGLLRAVPEADRRQRGQGRQRHQARGGRGLRRDTVLRGPAARGNRQDARRQPGRQDHGGRTS